MRLYDPFTKQVRVLSQRHNANRIGMALTNLGYGQLMGCGGMNTDSQANNVCEMFSGQTWTPVASLPTPSIVYNAMCTLNGEPYSFGGWVGPSTGGGPTNAIYALKHHQWMAMVNLFLNLLKL